MSQYSRLEQRGAVAAGNDEELGTPQADEAEQAKDSTGQQVWPYLPKPGIATPPRKRFRIFLLFRWGVAMLGLHSFVYFVLHTMTTQTLWTISASTHTLLLDLEHCNVQIGSGDSHQGEITLQHWNFLGDSSVREEDGVTKVQAHMSALMPMFRCMVTVQHPPEARLKHIHGRIDGEPLSRIALDAAPSESLDLRLHDAAVVASELPPKVNLKIAHGHVHITAGSDNGPSQVIVHSHHADFVVTSSMPMEVTAIGNAAKTSVFSAPVVKKSGSALLLGSSANLQALDDSSQHAAVALGHERPIRQLTPVLQISFETTHQAPGYFLAAGDDPRSLETVRGEDQDLAEPVLTKETEEELKDISSWMAQISATARPWEAKFRMRGPGLPCGSWQVVSSEAYFVVKLETLALTSGTLLHPDLRQGTLQLLSLKEQWPPKDANVHADTGCLTDSHIDRNDDTLHQVFHGIIKYLDIPDGATIAWVPDGEFTTPIIFKSRAGAWRTLYHKVISGQSLLFLGALALNVAASSIGASLLLFFLGKYGRSFIMNRLRRDTVAIAASQRITRQSSAQSWKVMATQVDSPHGVLLRWTKLTGERRPAYLWIYAEAYEDPVRGLPYDGVTIDRVKAEKVPTMSENTAISEFFFSVDQLCPGNIYESGQQNKALQYLQCYRFQVEALDANEDSMLKSEWSNEVFIAPKTSIFEMPLLLVKELCPVPTASLGYFIDHFATRHVHGKTPQQILVLSNITITYHKNFSDFKECNEKFYITVFAGDSRDVCQKETFSGRVKTFAQTSSFTPPQECVQQAVDDLTDEQRTQQVQAGELRLGRINEEVKQVTFSMYWADSGEDVAEGKIDWGDLMWEFEQGEREGGEAQTVEIDLVCESKEVFDEDYLVYLRAHVSFKNSVDKKCQEIERSRRFFSEDAPGQVFYQGMERFVTWDNASTAFSASTFDLYIEYPDLWQREGASDRSDDSNPRLLARDVQRSSVGITIMVDFPELLTTQKCVACQLYAQDKDGNKVLSHRFLICQTWLLTDMEMMYASFCKMNGVAMQNLNQDALQQFGLSTTNVQLKVVPNLRKPLGFESQELLFESPGCFMIRDNNITVKSVDDLFGDEAGVAPGDDDRSQLGGARSAAISMGSGGSKDKEGAHVERTFIVTSQRVQIMESIWPLKPTFPGMTWVPALLLEYDFYPVDNIINAMAAICELTRLDTLFAAVQFVIGAKMADNLLHFLLAPLYYLLPFLGEALLFLLQFCAFMALPMLPLCLAGALEYLKHEMNTVDRIVSSDVQLQACLPDAMFSSTLSGLNLELWLDTLSPVSKNALLAASGMYCVLVVFILEANFLRDAWPLWMQATTRGLLNDAGSFLVGGCVWCALFFCLMTSLWFVMAVVIYPEQMMVALSGVGGMAFIAFSMLVRYRATKEQISSFLKEEVPDVLDLVCDNFLNEFERQDLTGANQARSRDGEKLTETAHSETRKYIDGRFKGHAIGKLATKLGADNTQLFRRIFDRALLKKDHWDNLESAVADYESPRVVKTTEQILNESGLAQEDTSGMEHFTMRVRISDRETELRDKSVHQYSEDQRQKLMNVYVRCLEDIPPPSDVDQVLSDSKKFGKALFRAQKAKIEVFDRARLKGKNSLLQLFISDVNQQELKNYELIVARYLDVQLDSANISESVAAFIWREIPVEIQREMRLTLDEHCVGSAKQRAFESLRRWKNETLRAGGDSLLRTNLTLDACPMPMQDKTGLIKMLQDIGILDLQASIDYQQRVWRLLEGKVREWRDEEETGLVVNSNDLESFVRETLSGKLWWGAMQELLDKLGFPLFDDASGGRRADLLPMSQVRQEFEQNVHVQKNGGFLPKERVPDFLCLITRADKTDGGCGRIWKAQMVKLMQKLEICGFVHCPEGGRKKTRHDTENRGESLPELAKYAWPQWLRQAWKSKSPTWKTRGGDSVGVDMNTFMPKSELYAFLQDVTFMPSTLEELDHAFKVDEDYDNWRKQKDVEGLTVGIWTLRGKSFMELRGIWQECFIKILEDMSNDVKDRSKGVMLFELCREDQRKTGLYQDAEREGLLHVSYVVQWLRKELVQNTGECSLKVFRKVLERCELTLPPIVVTNLWHSAEATERFGNNWALRKVSDLEDRIVMYLVKGLPSEAVEGLILDVLSLPSLQDISPVDLKTTFQQVDTKLGMNGFLEPREVKALITCLAQAGMSLADLMRSLKRLGCDFPEKDIKEAFLLLDTSGDDLMDMPEFLGLMDYIIVRLIPQEILRVMGLQPQQVIMRLVFAIFMLVAVFLFIFISLGAFQVNVRLNSGAAGGGASLVRAGLALLAVVALKRESSEEDEERFFKNARERLYAMMGVTHNQIDARRRAMGIAMGSKIPALKGGKPGNFKLGSKGGKDDDEEDDDGGKDED